MRKMLEDAYNAYMAQNNDWYNREEDAEVFRAGAEWAIRHMWRKPEQDLPKDGTPVIVRRRYMCAKTRHWRIHITKELFFRQDRGFIGMRDKSIQETITHWMPIPPIQEREQY